MAQAKSVQQLVPAQRIHVKVDKLPRSTGGIRYAGMVGPEKFTVYVPQSVARELGNGDIPATLTVSFTQGSN